MCRHLRSVAHGRINEIPTVLIYCLTETAAKDIDLNWVLRFAWLTGMLLRHGDGAFIHLISRFTVDWDRENNALKQREPATIDGSRVVWPRPSGLCKSFVEKRSRKCLTSLLEFRD